MATIEECRAALDKLSDNLADADGDVRSAAALDRSLSCRITDLDITFTALMPRITPLTELGRPAVQAYAARSGQSEEEYVKQFGDPLTPEGAGAAVVELVQADAATVAPGYLLTGAGLQKLPD